MSWRVTPRPVKFEEAIAWLRERVAVTDEQFDTLSSKARQKAFTVAGVAQLDLVDEVLQSLNKAVDQGVPYETWARAVAPKLYAAWGGEKPWRLEIIFRTNVQLAYSAGRLEQLTDPEVLRGRPFWMYDAVLDSRTTGLCRGLNGTILPADHPWWDTHQPPLHFGCRSGIRNLTRAEAERRGITETPPGVEPQIGFGNVADSWDWQPEGGMAPGAEQERARPGKHFTEVRSSLSATDRDTVLRGAQRAGLLAYLERNPIPEVRIVSEYSDAQGPISGEYDPRTRSIVVSAQREELVAKLDPDNWGRIVRVSDVAASPALSMQKTFVHELSHDLLWRWAGLLGGLSAVEARVRPAYNAGNPVSLRAAFDWKEYFCETHAAYVYHRALLDQLDPTGRAIVEEVRKTLGIEAQP